MKITARVHKLEIHRGVQGGFRVTHHFAPKATLKRGAMSGGMAMQTPEPQEHLFGPGDNSAMLAHVAQALGVQNTAKTAETPGNDD